MSVFTSVTQVPEASRRLSKTNTTIMVNIGFFISSLINQENLLKFMYFASRIMVVLKVRA